ncbi:HK97-gp10 family putative phage morphogenesis protein [Roseixanthobacter pseudopolyaromaticivorans]|uniref:HK97-gp10 family putative phage morphogenesis protein n=1 Tax=Xanthobacteraceae TaxID=335928 RepID=UPI003729955C
MKTTRLSVTGLREIGAGLEQFKKSTASGVLRRVLKKAAKPVEDAAKSNAPVLTGKLRASITTQVFTGSPGKSAFAKAMRGGASRDDASAAARDANARAAGRGASATVRVKATAPHAHLVEFGTVHMHAEPFLGPALRTERGEVVQSIQADLKTEIEKTAKRVAARAAKKGIST